MSDNPDITNAIERKGAIFGFDSLLRHKNRDKRLEKRDKGKLSQTFLEIKEDILLFLMWKM